MQRFFPAVAQHFTGGAPCPRPGARGGGSAEEEEEEDGGGRASSAEGDASSSGTCSGVDDQRERELVSRYGIRCGCFCWLFGFDYFAAAAAIAADAAAAADILLLLMTSVFLLPLRVVVSIFNPLWFNLDLTSRPSFFAWPRFLASVAGSHNRCWGASSELIHALPPPSNMRRGASLVYLVHAAKPRVPHYHTYTYMNFWRFYCTQEHALKRCTEVLWRCLKVVLFFIDT